jgi:uncharacterized membrane protein
MKPIWWLTAAVIALEIPYPLVHGGARDALTIATVLVFATASVAHATLSRSPRYALTLLGVVGVGGFAAEAIGVHTGVPFGHYRYTGGLGPTVLDVPVVVALAWVMMAHPASTVAGRLTHGWRRIILAAFALASWDVFLDPQMVDAHHWRWADPSPHLPGVASVPLTNFAGWLFVSLLLMTLVHRVARHDRPRDDRPATVLWIWTWLSSTLANLAFFQRPAVAAWGFLAMGVVGAPLLMRSRPR